jgi:hypothetical protein
LLANFVGVCFSAILLDNSLVLAVRSL